MKKLTGSGALLPRLAWFYAFSVGLVDVNCTLKTVEICHYNFSLLTESFPSAFNRQGHANTFQSTIINAISPEIRSASPMIMMSINLRSDLRFCVHKRN